ncbi:MAG: energy transducer TonB [Gammaproteobacteria bacterium]|nr:energy transducer TonB [Gammaproteobacteria bacterium]
MSYNNISYSTSYSVDNLVTALFITLLLHVVIIFGVNFTAPEPKKSISKQTLDIVLVQTQAKEAPEKPDYLAQADQKGGGNLDEKSKPTSKNPGKTPQKGNSLQNKAETILKPVPEVKVKRSILSTTKSSKIKVQKMVKKKKKKHKKKKKAVAFSITELQQKIIEKEAMLDKQTKLYAKRPKATYISASTRRVVDALYMVQWTKKIERIGNLNYPDQAIRNKLEGRLLLVAVIAPNGHLINVEIRKSSGHTILDEAAKRIVRLAAPFAPVPKDVLRGNNRLSISRTWLFSQSSGKNFSIK